MDSSSHQIIHHLLYDCLHRWFFKDHLYKAKDASITLTISLSEHFCEQNLTSLSTQISIVVSRTSSPRRLLLFMPASRTLT